MNMNMIYDNEATQVLGPMPPLINNLILRRYEAMTEKSIPLFDSESQEVPLCKCGCGEPVTWNKCKRQFNIFLPGHNGRGIPHTEEHKRKISETEKGRIFSEETKRKISKANTGRVYSKEARMNMSKAHIGQRPSKESINKREITKIKKRQSKGLLIRGRYCDVWGDVKYINDLRKGACENCGITGMMSLKLFGCKLATHHMNGKKECAPNDIKTLCSRCHALAHIDEHWRIRREAKDQ